MSSATFLIRYELAKAHMYLRKAHKVLTEANAINYKIDGDFEALIEHCMNEMEKFKEIEIDR